MGFIKGTISVGRFSVSDNTVMGNDFEERIVCAPSPIFSHRSEREVGMDLMMIP